MSDRVVNWFQATTPLLGQEMEIRLGHNVVIGWVDAEDTGRRILAAIGAPPGSALTKSSSHSLQLLPDMSVMIRNFGTGTDKAQVSLITFDKPLQNWQSNCAAAALVKIIQQQPEPPNAVLVASMQLPGTSMSRSEPCVLALRQQQALVAPVTHLRQLPGSTVLRDALLAAFLQCFEATQLPVMALVAPASSRRAHFHQELTGNLGEAVAAVTGLHYNAKAALEPRSRVPAAPMDNMLMYT